MVAKLEGGCLVADFGEAELRGDKVSLRVIDVDGASTFLNESAEEVIYVIRGSGTANDERVAADSAIYLPPKVTLELEGKMTLVSTVCGADIPVCPEPGQTGMSGPHITSLNDKPLQRTGDRAYRELIQQQVTQFVGTIPPGRAPDHHHLYEEVICILDGEGVMWAGETSTPIATGSCIYLPRKQTHCIENKGSGDLKLLGVFYPAGSPAARYT